MPAFVTPTFLCKETYKSFALFGLNNGLAIYFICRLLCPLVKLLKVVDFLE